MERKTSSNMTKQSAMNFRLHASNGKAGTRWLFLRMIGRVQGRKGIRRGEGTFDRNLGSVVQ